MDFSIQIATIRMGLSIICFKGSPVDFLYKYVLQSLNIAFIIANSADSDEMQITKLPFIGFQYTKGVFLIIREFNKVMPLGPKVSTYMFFSYVFSRSPTPFKAQGGLFGLK